MTDVFLQWNSYAYGKGVYGEQSHKTPVQQLGSVDLTFNKSLTDEYDLLGCCCYFRCPWRPDQCRPGAIRQ